MKKNISHCLILFIIAFINCSPKETTQIPVAISGILDLRNYNFQKNVPLAGDWEFYLNHFLSPEDFKNNNYPTMTSYFSVPGIWSDIKVNGKKLTREGYATLHLVVKINHSKPEQFALEIPSGSHPLKLFINNKLVAKVGQPGTTKVLTKYDSFPQCIEFSSAGESIDIILQISNFHRNKTAGSKIFTLGANQIVQDTRNRNMIIQFFLYGNIFIVGIFFLFVYILKKQPTSLFFAFCCFLIPLRASFIGATYILMFFPWLPWEIKNKILYCSTYLIVISIFSYVYNLFKIKFSNIYYRGIIIIHFLLILIVILTPSSFFRYTSYIHHLLCFLGICYNTYVCIKYFVIQKKISIIFLFGILIFGLLSAFSSLLYYFRSLNIDYLVLYGFFFFLIFQIYLFAEKYAITEDSNVDLENKLSTSQIELTKIKDGNFEKLSQNMEWFSKEYNISKRELEIINLILHDETNNQIADKLNISYFTVRRHLNNIYRKIQISNRNDLLKILGKGTIL